MIVVLRQVALLAVAAVLSWWAFLGTELPKPVSKTVRERPLPMNLMPLVEVTPKESLAPVAAPPPEASVQEASSALPEDEPELPELETEAVADVEPPAAEPEPEEPLVAEEDAPPPPEIGTPEGEGDALAAEVPELAEAADTPAETADDPAVAESLMADAQLVEDARQELAGEARQGYATVLLAAPEDQIDIARFFGEELVLVPRRALVAEDPTYFRLRLDGSPRVEQVAENPRLERYRQYRDLFDYEYARLPEALRDLRKSVLARTEVYVFAALIPVSEWAVVVGRRREALSHSGRDLADARRFLLRYQRRDDRGFDIRVEEIVFTDGTRYRPPETE